MVRLVQGPLTPITGIGHQINVKVDGSTISNNNVPMDANALGRLKRLAGKQTIILTHYGRKSGNPYEVKIWFVVDGDKVFIGTGERAAAVGVERAEEPANQYAATGGWGFADFTGGKPGDKARHESCFACHTPAKDRDYVFTRYAP